MKFVKVEFFISHNQGVPGSSPGGTTSKIKPYRDVRLFCFYSGTTFTKYYQPINRYIYF